jgi:ribonuclease HII
MIVCGVDDAGRGCMLGPLVIAGVSIKRSNLRKLSSIGVKDSKQLCPKKRELLYKQIIKFAEGYHIARIYPRTIDNSVSKHNLNNLEAKYMAKVIAKLKPNISYVDSCDVNPKRFTRVILDKLSEDDKVKSYHHADSRFVVVSAASIIAKVARDKAIMNLKKRYGDLGSGYPSDRKTVKFVKNHLYKHEDIPKFIRASWKPVQRIIATKTSGSTRILHKS